MINSNNKNNGNATMTTPMVNDADTNDSHK